MKFIANEDLLYIIEEEAVVFQLYWNVTEVTLSSLQIQLKYSHPQFLSSNVYD